MVPTSIYDIGEYDIDGNLIYFNDYRDRVLIITNVASQVLSSP